MTNQLPPDRIEPVHGLPSGPAIDQWLSERHQAMTNDLPAVLDLEAGLREVLLAADHGAVAADIAAALDLDAGLDAILPTLPSISGPDTGKKSKQWPPSTRAGKSPRRGGTGIACSKCSASLEECVGCAGQTRSGIFGGLLCATCRGTGLVCSAHGGYWE